MIKAKANKSIFLNLFFFFKKENPIKLILNKFTNLRNSKFSFREILNKELKKVNGNGGFRPKNDREH